MGHGPAVQRSTNEQYAEFKAKSEISGSVTYSAVEVFKKKYEKIDLAKDSELPSITADELIDLNNLTANESEENAEKYALKSKPTELSWGYSKEEFARLTLAAQSLVRLTKTEIAVDANGKEALIITVDNKAHAPWPIPSYEKPTNTDDADLKGAYSNEVWLQDSQLILFMLKAATNVVAEDKFNTHYLGLAVDVAAQAIPPVLFNAKAQVRAPRPYELYEDYPVALPHPAHSSWPGGHAFWCGALSVLLFQALKDKMAPKSLGDALRQAAKRIANNRVSAGLHWPKDTDDGIAQGRFVMHEWIRASKEKAKAPGAGDPKDTRYPGDAGDLWRLIKEV